MTCLARAAAHRARRTLYYNSTARPLHTRASAARPTALGGGTMTNNDPRKRTACTDDCTRPQCTSQSHSGPVLGASAVRVQHATCEGAGPWCRPWRTAHRATLSTRAHPCPCPLRSPPPQLPKELLPTSSIIAVQEKVVVVAANVDWSATSPGIAGRGRTRRPPIVSGVSGTAPPPPPASPGGSTRGPI